MIFLFSIAGFLNLLFYIFAIGFVIALMIEQLPVVKENERSLYIVQTNRKYCWRQAWVTNIFWFLCNVGLYLSQEICKHQQTHFGTDYEDCIMFRWSTQIYKPHELW